MELVEDWGLEVEQKDLTAWKPSWTITEVQLALSVARMVTLAQIARGPQEVHEARGWAQFDLKEDLGVEVSRLGLMGWPGRQEYSKGREGSIHLRLRRFAVQVATAQAATARRHQAHLAQTQAGEQFLLAQYPASGSRPARPPPLASPWDWIRSDHVPPESP